MTQKSIFRLLLAMVGIVTLLFSGTSWAACPGVDEYQVYNALLIHLAEKSSARKWAQGDPQIGDDHGDSVREWAHSMWERSLGGGASGYIIMELETARDIIDSNTLRFLLNKLDEFPDTSIVKDYNSKSEVSCNLSAEKFDTLLSVNLISRADLDSIFEAEGWSTFYEKFPAADGLVWLSRIGFDRSEKFALVLYQRQFGGIGGSGTYYLLEKVGEEWKIKASAMSWIS